MIYRIILFCFSLVLFNNAYAQVDSVNFIVKPAKTNEEIAAELINKNLEDLKSLLESDTVYVDIQEKNSSMKNFFNNKLRNSLVNYSIRPFNTGLTNIPARLEIKNVKVSVSYPHFSSEGVIGNKNFNRIVNISFDVSYNRLSDNTVIYSRRVDDKYSDEVDISLKGKIENRNYSFLVSELPEDNFFNRYLIPAGLIVISAATIVLFFAIRSN